MIERCEKDRKKMRGRSREKEIKRSRKREGE